tara:strand:- start:302 stop:511 length:210 start_codon:yes stop_codon:yes gene_type:complete
MHQMLGEQPTCKYLESMISACFLDLLVKRLPRESGDQSKMNQRIYKDSQYHLDKTIEWNTDETDRAGDR